MEKGWNLFLSPWLYCFITQTNILGLTSNSLSFIITFSFICIISRDGNRICSIRSFIGYDRSVRERVCTDTNITWYYYLTVCTVCSTSRSADTTEILAAVQVELSVVLNQHRLQSLQWSTFTSYLTSSFWKTKEPRGAATNLKWLEWFASAYSESKWRLGERSTFNSPTERAGVPGFLWSTASLRSIGL